MEPVWQVFRYALLTAVCTWLGALPFIFKRSLSKTFIANASAVAAALMIAASFGLIYQWIDYDASVMWAQWLHGISSQVWGVLGWVLLGLVFIVIADYILGKHNHLKVYDLNQVDAKKFLLIVGIMTLHSFTEGIAVGVSFWPSLAFGVFIALAIALHNIPEGLAISAVLVPRGIKWRKAGLRSIFSSLPQPLMAIPAYYFVHQFTPHLPWGLWFAAGAMLWMAFAELLPDALQGGSKSTVAAIATVAIMLMVMFQQFLG